MTERDLAITKRYSLFDNEQKDRVAQLALNEGWGVLEAVSGISGMPHQRLRNVWRQPHDANVEAERLNEEEGELEFEISGDPESNIYRSVSFFVSKVALTGVKAEIVSIASYTTVE